MATVRNEGYRSGLVDMAAGQISREIFVNEEIYQQELERLFAGSGSSSDTRARSLNPGISLSRGWARNRSSSAATGRGRSMSF